MTEGFNNNPLTSKIILHAKQKGSLPDWNLRMIPYWNVFSKREIYYSGGPFSNKIMGKTEIGGSIEVGRYSLLELGSLLRFNSNYENTGIKQLNWQTTSPFIRFNLRGRRHFFPSKLV